MFNSIRRFERGFYDGSPIDAVRFIRRDDFLSVGGFDEKLFEMVDEVHFHTSNIYYTPFEKKYFSFQKEIRYPITQK